MSEANARGGSDRAHGPWLLAAACLVVQACGAFEPTIEVRALTIAPDSRTLTSLGATQQFTAEARDSGGNVLADITFTWSSTDTSVATVDATGLATSQAPGTASIIAEAQGVADTATLVVDTSSSNLRSVVVPSQGDWTDHGSVLSGNLGGWDAVLVYPAAVLKRSGTLYVYYVAGDGTRSDGGAANRKLGLATADPASPGVLTKHPSNPLVEHAVGVTGCEECGVFSAGSVLEDDGTVRIYFGGMEETSLGNVDGDIVHTAASDGVSFGEQTDVLRASDPATYGDDENLPHGAIEIAGSYHVYYAATGSGIIDWTMAVTRSSSADSSFDSGAVVSGPRAGSYRGSGDPILMNDSTILLPFKADTGVATIEWRSGPTADPTDLSTLEASYTLTNVSTPVVYLDRDTDTWLLYYRRDSQGTIGLQTAPAEFP